MISSHTAVISIADVWALQLGTPMGECVSLLFVLIPDHSNLKLGAVLQAI